MADTRTRTSHVTRDSDGAVFQVLGPGEHDGRPVVFLCKPGAPSHVSVTPLMLAADFTAVVLDSAGDPMSARVECDEDAHVHVHGTDERCDVCAAGCHCAELAAAVGEDHDEDLQCVWCSANGRPIWLEQTAEQVRHG